MKKIGKVGPGELWCGGCNNGEGKAKAAYLFTESQKKDTDGARRCMECQRKKAKENRKKFNAKAARDAVREGNNWLFARAQ
jgi:hypothetical protein